MYKIKYDGNRDVLIVVFREKGKLSHAEEIGGIMAYFDHNGKPYLQKFLELTKMLLSAQ